jgi:putative lipoprotein
VSLAFKIITILIILLIITPLTYAGEKDRWFTRDKYEHFAISMIYSSGATFIAHRHFEISKSKAPAVGFGFSITLGAAKEVGDFATHKGTASGKDFIWDIAGALAGAIAVGLSL